MAYQAPTADRRHQLSSVNSHPIRGQNDFYLDTPGSPSFSRSFHPQEPTEQDEEEWVVFSPSVTIEQSTVYGVTETYTNDDGAEPSEIWTERQTLRRRGGVHSTPAYTTEYSESEEDEGEDEDEENDRHMVYGMHSDDEDSLGPFRENKILLPTHDGRGMFPLSASQGSGSALISGIVSLEESLRQLAARTGLLEQVDDVNTRIQKWRLEHSTAFMEEIESMSGRSRSRTRSERDVREEMEASMMLDDDDETSSTTETETGQKTVVDANEDEEAPETFWRRVTRSLMRDIMGIDDTVLEVLFGEALPPSALEPSEENVNAQATEQSWERKLLERIARELGVLLQQYTIHPTQGAFSSYTRWKNQEVSNCGWDQLEEEEEGSKTPTPRPRSRSPQHPRSPPPATAQEQKSFQPVSVGSSILESTAKLQFTPTLANIKQTQFTSEDLTSEDDHRTTPDPAKDAQLRKEYWEQELGVRVFFSYIKSRFSSSSSSSSSANTQSQPQQQPSRPVRKSSISETREQRPVYRTHPLIQRRYQQNHHRRTASASSHSGTPNPMMMSWGMLGVGGYRNGSSCASQNTRTSKRGTGAAGKSRASVGSPGGQTAAATGTASSLNKSYYWEVETSVGSGGAGGCVGGGAWGEI